MLMDMAYICLLLPLYPNYILACQFRYYDISLGILMCVKIRVLLLLIDLILLSLLMRMCLKCYMLLFFYLTNMLLHHNQICVVQMLNGLQLLAHFLLLVLLLNCLYIRLHYSLLFYLIFLVYLLLAHLLLMSLHFFDMLNFCLFLIHMMLSFFRHLVEICFLSGIFHMIFLFVHNCRKKESFISILVV